MMIARELTKLHEQVLRTTTEAACDLAVPEKGEFTIVLGPKLSVSKPLGAPNPIAVRDYFGHLTESNELSRRQALSATAREFGLSTNEVYALLERLKTASPP
jgi:16S rRNA C1402 (ribose-2'-O) methylase RsmI